VCERVERDKGREEGEKERAWVHTYCKHNTLSACVFPHAAMLQCCRLYLLQCCGRVTASCSAFDLLSPAAFFSTFFGTVLPTYINVHWPHNQNQDGGSREIDSLFFKNVVPGIWMKTYTWQYLAGGVKKKWPTLDKRRSQTFCSVTELIFVTKRLPAYSVCKVGIVSDCDHFITVPFRNCGGRSPSHCNTPTLPPSPSFLPHYIHPCWDAKSTRVFTKTLGRKK
jgi:hypothetical protein